MLRRNFGDRWTQQEFQVPRRDNATAVARFLSENTEIDALSSHTALLPVPCLAGIDIFPIVFVRHPIDRIRSAYEFERNQFANTAGARLARNHDFAGYVRELLGRRHHRQVRNFQTFRLSHNETRAAGSEIERALRALAALKFVGLVEHFGQSIERLEQELCRIYPTFRGAMIHKNATASRATNLQDRLSEISASLGEELLGRLIDANQDDLLIYSRLSSNSVT